MSSIELRFVIADVKILLNSVSFVSRNEQYMSFLSHDCSADYTVNIQPVSILDTSYEECMLQADNFDVVKKNGAVIRRFKDRMSDDYVYALRSELSDHSAQIRYLENYCKYFSEMSNCWYHMVLEDVMLKFNRMILHASFIDTEYGGILFSGPSGIGKSTQAELWQKYRNAEQINGDRPILGKDSSMRWMAYGSPYAGSSRCYINKKSSIRAIVILQQSKINRIRRLKGKEAFLSIYRNITINTWDKEFVEKVSEMVLDLISNVPVYELQCTPDLKAVEVLESVLEKEVA